MSGTAETAPGAYIIMGGDIQPDADKPINSYEIAGQPFPTLAWKGAETFKMPFPMLPVIEDATSPTVRRNGLGELLLCFFGADTPAQLSSSSAYTHVFSWNDLIKTFTAWLDYSERDQKIRMCAVNQFELGISADGECTLDFDVMGANLYDTTDYGSASQIDLATAKQLTGLGAYLEWGQPGAGARDAWEDLTLTLNRNLEYGAPGKAGQHPTGSGSPQIVSSAKSEATLKFTVRDADGEEYERWREGGVIDPTADYHTDLVATTKARLSIYGPTINQTVNGFADYNNAGTTTAVFAGTYGGGSTVTIGEIEMSDSDIYETSLSSNKDLSFKLLDPDATYEVVTGAGALSVAVVAKAITVTLAAAGSTASAVLAAIIANGDTTALITPTLANGSTGAGTITEAQAQITSANFKDGFRYRYTTGGTWSAWTAWIKVTEAAQDLVSSMTVDFSDDDKASDGDKFYFASHYRYCLKATLPQMIIKKVTPSFSGGVRKLTIEAFHASSASANRPFLEMYDTKTTAYS